MPKVLKPPTLLADRQLPYPTSLPVPSSSDTIAVSAAWNTFGSSQAAVGTNHSSSASWPKASDEILMKARQQGLNWQPIADIYFPNKSANACRKRHERLMEMRNTISERRDTKMTTRDSINDWRDSINDWDGTQMDTLAMAYTEVREQIWRVVADKVGGEEWQVIESKCMEKGLQALLTTGRTALRRVQSNAVQLDKQTMTNIKDHADRHRSHPDSDDGFNDSGIGPDSDHPTASRTFSNSAYCPTTIAERLFPSQIPSSLERQHSGGNTLEGHKLPSFSSTFGIPSASAVTTVPMPSIDRRGNNMKSCEGTDDHNYEIMNDMTSKSPNPEMSQQGTYATSSIDVSNLPNSHLCENTSSEGLCSVDNDSPPSESGPSPLSEHDLSRLEVLYAKHQVVANIMRDLYVLFDRQWTGGTKNCTVHENASTVRPSTVYTNASGTIKNRKRKSDDLDPEQPGDGDDSKRRNRGAKQPGETDEDRLYACPFNKFAPRQYCVTENTGQKYRTCWGPGFRSIARLRQHLRRVHKTPNQCSRCWITLPSDQELSQHMNEEQRCESREPRPEGINRDKMDLIQSQHGVCWEKIYGIIFPGAPVHNPYIELDTSSEDLIGTSPSAAAQSFQEFNEYNRIALPLLVEASLQSIVQSKIAPIEEEVRVLLVDIVRRSQSTVAQNFEQAQQLKVAQAQQCEGPPARAQESSQKRIIESSKTAQMPTTGAVIPRDVTTHYQEPPFSDFPVDFASFLCPPQDPPKQASDSGYGTNDSSCACPCHLGIGSSSLLNDLMDCDFCATKHPSQPNNQFER